MSDELHIKTFGGLSVKLDGQPISGFASRKVEALLVYLACEARPHPREVLADLLWDDRPQRQAMANLRVVLASLRKEVGPFVTITRQTAAIDGQGSVWLDAAKLEQAIGGIDQQPTPEKAKVLASALELYGGDFLLGHSLFDASGWEAWLVAARERFHGLAVAGFERLAAWHLAQGESEAAIAVARRLLEIDPLSEAGYRQLMEGLARAGRRGEALTQYERATQLLWDELGLAPAAATQALAEAIQQGELEPLPPVEPVVVSRNPYELPVPAGPLIGRQSELDDICKLLAGPVRLVSIVGPGGMGKTRLALEVAHSLSGRLPDGAAFVDLTAISTAGGIIPAMAHSLGIPVEQSPKLELLDHLRDRTLLLVLDNFEQLVDEAGLLSEMVEAAPGLRLLVTSREALNLRAEHIYPLSGLAYHAWESVAAAERDGTGALFLHHARRLRPSFSLKEADLQPLGLVVRLVAGMPLPLILAAGWEEVLGLPEIAAEIGRSLDFLEAEYRDLPERQRSMRAVFQATWARLDAQEQAIFAALSVCHGGFTLAAARAVAGATPRQLLSLVRRSLLARSDDGRFAVHELLRQFAAEELARLPEAEAEVRERHSIFYLGYLHELEPVFKSARHEEAVAEITVEFENARAAWNWAADHNQVVRLADAILLGNYCAGEERGIEALALFERAVYHCTPLSPREQRAYGLLVMGLAMFTSSREDATLSGIKGRYREALEHLAAAAAAGEDVRYEEAFALAMLGQTDDDILNGRAVLERSLAL